MSFITDMADSKKIYLSRNDGEARQLRENLMKILYIDDDLNYNHWKQEFATHYLNMVDTKIANDSKSNRIREKCLDYLLIESPYGEDGEDFVYNSLRVANCAFASESVKYNSSTLKNSLEVICPDAMFLFRFLISLQNEEENFVREEIYAKLDRLHDMVDVKFKRE